MRSEQEIRKAAEFMALAYNFCIDNGLFQDPKDERSLQILRNINTLEWVLEEKGGEEMQARIDRLRALAD